MDWVLEEALSRCEYFQTTTKLQLPTAFQSALCFLQCVLSFFKALEFAWHALQFPCLTCCNAKIKSSKPAQLTAPPTSSLQLKTQVRTTCYATHMRLARNPQ